MPKLKKATKKGTKEIAKIYATEFSKPPYNENWDYESANNKIKLFSKYCDIWKVVNDSNKIIGFAIINVRFNVPGTIAFIEQMAIKHEYQKQGIGKEVVQSLIETYMERGFQKVMAIANKKSKAFKLYKDLGIEESKDNVLIERDLQ